MRRRFKLMMTAIILFTGFLASCGSAQNAAQKEAAATKIRQQIQDFDFTFNATYAYPMGYKSIYLSPYYTVKVSQDTVKAYLPYYGRAYVAPTDPSRGGINFTSTKFDYRVKEGKKDGNWRVEIKTKDTDREILLNFDIWDNGSAKLDVTDPNRQPISFQGNISKE
ncbi:hypothetical protein C0T31_08545 [Dysgonamonadaceae bacterium]|nr:hypothetical protein C0T31_08545 [Dysgonamonadaceae bacterium]